MTSLGKAWSKLPSAEQVKGFADTGLKAVDAASQTYQTVAPIVQ